MTHWYEPHIVAVQKNDHGVWRDWRGGPMTLREAVAARSEGKITTVQARDGDSTYLVAVKLKNPVPKAKAPFTARAMR